MAAKKCVLEQAPGGYFILSSLAGIYLGLEIALIFSLGGPLAAVGSPVVKLVMGVIFRYRIDAVIFAGSELFTGNNDQGPSAVCHVPILDASHSAQCLVLVRKFWPDRWAGLLIVESGVFAKGAVGGPGAGKSGGGEMSLPAWGCSCREFFAIG